MRRIVVALVAVTSACDLAGEPAPTATGLLQASGGMLGTWDFVPSPALCVSGDAHEFGGVDLADGTRAVRLVDDPATGYALVVAIGGDPSYPTVVLQPGDCARFEATLAHDSDDYDTVSGSFSMFINARLVGTHVSLVLYSSFKPGSFGIRLESAVATNWRR